KILTALCIGESTAGLTRQAPLYEHGYRQPGKDYQWIKTGHVEEAKRLIGSLAAEPARHRGQEQRDARGRRTGKVGHGLRNRSHEGEKQAEDDDCGDEGEGDPGRRFLAVA